MNLKPKYQPHSLRMVLKPSNHQQLKKKLLQKKMPLKPK
jgi:hypothetical protein